MDEYIGNHWQLIVETAKDMVSEREWWDRAFKGLFPFKFPFDSWLDGEELPLLSPDQPIINLWDDGDNKNITVYDINWISQGGWNLGNDREVTDAREFCQIALRWQGE